MLQRQENSGLGRCFLSADIFICRARPDENPQMMIHADYLYGNSSLPIPYSPRCQMRLNLHILILFIFSEILRFFPPAYFKSKC